jgi:subtilisin-like proprotein convertase family protein
MLKRTCSKIPVILLGLLWASMIPLYAQITETYTYTTNRVLPDGDTAGLCEARTVNSAIANISSVKVKLQVAGEYNGDLYVYLKHGSGFTILLNRSGKSATDLSGYDDSGFDVTFQAAADNGDIHNYRNNDTPSMGEPLTGEWEPDGRAMDPTSSTDDTPRTAILDSFNGLNATGDWTLYLADVEAGGTNMLVSWELQVSGGAYPSFAWSPENLIYGNPLCEAQLNATATYAGTNISGSFDYSPGIGTLLDSGDNRVLAVTFTPDDSAAFLALTTNVRVNVAKAALTLTASNASRSYGVPNPDFSGSFSGVQNGDSLIDTYTCAATTNSPAGIYVIQPSASGGHLTNYNLTLINGSLLITPANTSATLVSSQNPALPGSSVFFTMTVSAVSPATGTPSGNVRFAIDGSTMDTVELSNGIAIYSTSSLSHGTHTIAATYAGDGNFTASSASLSSEQNINTPPGAGTVTIERYPLQGVKVRLATLLANASDADEDTLSISVTNTSANGGAITISGNWIFYTPPIGFTNADSFTYTLSDGHGGSVVGNVIVALKVDNEPGQNLIATLQGNGTFLIQGSGIPARIYHLQYSDSLTPPNWQALGNATVAADATGAFSYVDTPPIGTTARYYRTTYP